MRKMPCWVKPIVAPFPRVASDAVESVAVWFEAPDGAGAGEAIGAGVLLGEASLPNIAAVFVEGGEVVAPRIRFLIESAACRIFPFGFGWETFLCPGAVGHRIVP